MSSEAPKLLIIGLLGAAAAVAANRNVAIYHDGQRTSVADLDSGRKSRRELGAYAYSISIGFVVAFVLPYALASGILIIHMVMLGADTVGVRCRRMVEAAGAAALERRHRRRRRPVRPRRAAPAAGDDGARSSVAAAQLRAAAARCGDRRGGARVPRWPHRHGCNPGAVGDRLLGTACRVRASATVFGAGVAAFAVVMAVLVAASLRDRAENETDLAFFDDTILRIRRNWPYLGAVAGLIAITASARWIGGDPVQVALMGSHDLEGAAAVAVFSTIGFVPLQGMTGLVSAVWSQHGYPDWILGAGYLTGDPLVAGVAGAGLMVVELLTLRRVAWLLTTRPGVSDLGSTIREALEIVPNLAMLAGGVLAATAVGGPAGAFVVIGTCVLNDKRGRPVMPLAAPVIGYLLVLIGTGIAHQAGLFT